VTQVRTPAVSTTAGREEFLADFQQYRPLLLGLAYRLLGSMWDAEDTVQDAYLRLAGTDWCQVQQPRAYLITVVSRLALDRLRSAQVRREDYTGPWLPEPIDTASLGPLDTAELRDSVSYATMHMLERLSPPQRAVFVLREAFGVPYEDIASVVGVPPANCRQLLLRARRRLADGARRPAGSAPASSTPEEHSRLLVSFLDAARTGDLQALNGLLADDVVAWNDGGGRVRAARRPITGRQQVLAFVAGLAGRYDIGEARLVEVNGHPALHTHLAGGEQLVALRVVEGRIQEIYALLNPDKLGRLAEIATAGG